MKKAIEKILKAVIGKGKYELETIKRGREYHLETDAKLADTYFMYKLQISLPLWVGVDVNTITGDYIPNNYTIRVYAQ